MRGLAANDAAERDIAVKARPGAARACERGKADGSRDFEGAGHGDAGVARARRLDRCQRALEKLGGDVRVIGRLDDEDVRR
jgi:hypothetical protein